MKILLGIVLLVGLALAALVLGVVLSAWWAVRRGPGTWSGPGVKRVRNEALDARGPEGPPGAVR